MLRLCNIDVKMNIINMNKMQKRDGVKYKTHRFVKKNCGHGPDTRRRIQIPEFTFRKQIRMNSAMPV